MRTFFSVLLVATILVACGGDDEVLNDLTCEKARTEMNQAKDAYVAKLNAYPPSNAAPSVKEQYEKDLKTLADIQHEKIEAWKKACGS